MSSSANNIVINPVNLFWRIEAQTQVTTVADVSDSLDGTYFTLMGTHYVWFDGVVAADPAPVGLTAIAVAYATDDTASTLAGLVQVAVDADAAFGATVSGSVVIVTAAAVGEQTDSADVDSGVDVLVCRKGKDVDLGLLDGEPSPTSEPSTFDVTSQQTGTTPLSSLVQGVTAEIEVSVLETTKSKLKEFYKIWGGAFTPAAGTEVFGMGTGAVGKNMLVEAARLEMIPVNSLGAELSYNYNFMLAVPVPSSLTFSGENPRILTLNFKAYPDLSKDSRVDTVLIGDPTQTGI